MGKTVRVKLTFVEGDVAAQVPEQDGVDFETAKRAIERLSEILGTNIGFKFEDAIERHTHDHKQQDIIQTQLN